MESIHSRIKRLRTSKGLSLEAFAGLVGVKWQSAQQWEREGGTAPSRKRMATAAAALGVSVEELVSGRPLDSTNQLEYGPDPRAAKMLEHFYFLTDEQKAAELQRLQALAEANRVIVKQLRGRLNPPTDEHVGNHLRKTHKDRK